MAHCSECKQKISMQESKYSISILKKALCRKCQKKYKKPTMVSTEEKILSHALLRLGLVPKVQYKIDRMTVDFAFPNEKVVVEVDGDHHLDRDIRDIDGNRDDFLQTKGWKIRRYSAKQVRENSMYVAERIQSFIERCNGTEEKSGNPFENWIGVTLNIIGILFLVLGGGVIMSVIGVGLVLISFLIILL